MASRAEKGNRTIEKLHALQARYARELTPRLDALDAAWRTIDDGGYGGDDLKNLHLLLHRLAGSGATFGFSAISEIARNLEGIVLSVIDDAAALDDAARQTIREGLVQLRDAAHTPVSIAPGE